MVPGNFKYSEFVDDKFIWSEILNCQKEQDAHAKVQNWISNAHLPGNWFGFGII